MARTYQTRKRSGGPIVRNRKRTRRFKRRTGRRQSQFSTNSTVGGGIQFKRRGISRRRYKNLLWTASQASTHYRSNSSAAQTLNTPGVSAGTMNTSLQTTRRFAGAAFWVTAGGAINPDGGAMPTFSTNTDITVRGGMYGIRLANTVDALDVDKDPLSVIVYLIRTSKGFTTAALPANVPVGWDPSLTPDFQTSIGRVVQKKVFLIRDGDVFTIERRMAVQKIDQTEYSASISEYVWMVLLGTTSSTASKQLSICTYYNMSFVGDTV